MNLSEYRKCLYCARSGFVPDMVCTRDGKNTPCKENDVCDFFEIYNESVGVVKHDIWDLKRCGLHGCNVNASEFNDNCACVGCFGAHCHICGTRQTRTKLENIFKNMARCAFCRDQK